jgi:hypothetical protein
MLGILTKITLALTVVIIAVVAVHLILIAAALQRANRNLEKLVGGLEAIRDNTAPLGQDLPTINGAAVALRDRLSAVDHNLQKVIQLVRG